MKVLRVTIAFGMLLVIAVVVTYEADQLTSPGGLHPTHAAVPALAGQAGCDACHGESGNTLTAGCVSCHDVIQRQIDDGASLHGGLQPNQAIECDRCHREHTDGLTALVGDLSFVEAGVTDRRRYDHGHIRDFTLMDRHDSLGCRTCHEFCEAPFLRAGQRRYLGLSQECASCHEDPHVPTYGPDCGSCHGQSRPFDEVAEFEHHPEFPLTGGHDELACRACHDADRGHSIAELQHAPREPRMCVDCHDSPHQDSFLAGVGTLLGQAGATRCEECHDSEHDSFRHPPAVMTADLHAATGFPLDPPHDLDNCILCHEAANGGADAPSDDGPVAFTRRYPGRSAQECAACHADPHAPSFGTDCVACHGGTEPFSAAATFAHDPSFPLIGGHGGLTCNDCHDASLTHSVAALRSAPHDTRLCAECHESSHRAPFLTGVGAIFGMDANKSCEVCHAVEDESFLRPAATMTPELHVASGFPLESPHDAVDCRECHVPAGSDPAERGEFPAAIRTAPDAPIRAPQNCAACHGDPHQGQFELAVTGRTCLDCHDPHRFLPSNFDLAQHDRSHFPLTGAHRAIACVSCHPVEHSVRRFVPVNTGCADCHEDAHRGRYAPEGALVGGEGPSGCLRCHNTTSFTDIPRTAEAHLLWSDYVLRGAHARAGCADCHPRRSTPTEFGMRLGPASTDCGSCHADPHGGQFNVGGASDCSRCHSETTNFRDALFDHQLDSRFHLDEFHRTLDCGACHKPVTLGTGVTIIRYRPLGTECADCHGVR